MTGFIVFWWLLLTVGIAVLAHRQGLSGWGYFFLGLIFSPLLSLAVVGTARRNDQVIEQRALRRGYVKKCFMCAELIKVEALRCPHCHADVSPSAAR